MRKVLLVATILALLCSVGSTVILIGAAHRGAESAPGRVLEFTYPLWGWCYEYLEGRGFDLPFNEIHGRGLARKAYRSDAWHLWGTGYSSTHLSGLHEDDPPIAEVPELQACRIAQPRPEDPLELAYQIEIRKRATWRPEHLAENDDLIVCHLDDGRTVEFVAHVMPHPCIDRPWLHGFNRKTIELLAADDNWPPADDGRRLTSFSEFEQAMY